MKADEQDTATLFGNIENGHDTDAPGKTSKSLDKIAQIMFGGSEESKPRYTANAGNRASVSSLRPSYGTS